MYSHGEGVLAVNTQSPETVLEQQTPAFLVHVCSAEAVVLEQHTHSSLGIHGQHNPSPVDIHSAEAVLEQHTHASLDILEQQNPSSPLNIHAAESVLGQRTHSSPVDM